MTAKKTFVVITSINRPSEAIHEFARWSGWHLIVVGDRKTPEGWQCDGVTYLGIEQQYDEFAELARMVPENTYTRKVLGYVYAMRRGATAIFETDDDNIPYAGAQAVVELDILDRKVEVPSVRSEGGWVNIYAEFGASACWPRGYPLHALKDPVMAATKGHDSLPWGVLQYLADEDPDVDAVYRMTRGEPVFFARNRSLCLARQTYSPFNSQATLWLPEFFPLMFLPVGVSDRVTDILRGYMALACLWKCESTLRFSSPLVYQRRNPHNLLRDFEQEIDLYRYVDRWSKLLLGVQGKGPARIFQSAIDILIRDGAIPDRNNIAYETFLNQASIDSAA